LLDKPEADLTDKQKKALKILSEKLHKKDYNENEMNELFRDIAKESDMDAKQFFSGVYQTLLGRNHGPRLASFIIAIGQKKITDILKKIK